MASSYDATINSFYLAYYGRPADPSGLAFWSMQLEVAHGDFGLIVNAFANSEEAQVRFGSSDATARITQIYEQLYNRAPDADGLAFWTKAIANGDMTMADAAIQILHGAQGSDAGLAALRQTAVEQFTAEVAKSGLAYDGYAAIEAARVLVKAVSLNASAADIDAMVASTAKLVQIAHDNPKVVEAIAVGTTLEKLFDTARGHAEAVNLVKTLADVAAVAAGDPVTLESLLRGGGMAKVLEVMPAAATLADVVKALATGGLPAAVEVVYPTAPTVPAAPLKLAFVSVSEDTQHDPVHDNVTNVGTADVTFSYSRALSSNQHVEWSTDGGTTWHTNGFDLVARTIVIHNVDLTGHPGFVPTDTTTTVQVRVVEGASKVVATIGQDIVHDGYVATPRVVFDTSATHVDMLPEGVIVTNQAAYILERIEDGAKVEYVVLDNNPTSSTWTSIKPVLHEGENTFIVRQTDKAGNVATKEVSVKLDTAGPTAQAALALDADTGTSATDGLTNSGKVNITGLDTHEDTAWEYSLDQGKQWIAGAVNDGSGTGVVDLSQQGDGGKTVWVRQYDAAGNIGDTVSGLTFTLDTTAPDVTFTFASVEGNDDSTHPASTKSTLVDVVFDYKGKVDTGDVVQWRTGNGTWKTLDSADIGQDSVTIRDLDVSNSDPTVQIKIGDTAGNTTEAYSTTIDGPYQVVPLTVSAVRSGLEIKAGVPGTLIINDGKSTLNLAVSTGVDAIAGTGGVAAQAHVYEGAIGLKGTNGTLYPDSAPKFYRLGSDGVDQLGGGFSWGFGGNDVLQGDSKNADHLYGGDGDDIITGNGGADILSGGAGADTFKFNNGNSVYDPVAPAQVAYATITDFEGNGVDKITFTSPSWSPLSTVAVSSTLYASLDAALADVRISLQDINAGNNVFAAQVGADTYVFARTSSGSSGYVDGIDTVVKLAKFTASDFTFNNVTNTIMTTLTGNGTVLHSGAFAGDSRGATALYVHGVDGGADFADTIVGGTANDVLVGGKGADLIKLSGGIDTLVYDAPADSNLAGLGANQPTTTYDTVMIAGNADVKQVRFVFGGDLLGVHSVDTLQDLHAGDFAANLDAIYRQVATSRYDAVLIGDGQDSFLVVNNGDDVIDGNDYVVKIVGSGSIALDTSGAVVFAFTPTDL